MHHFSGSWSQGEGTWKEAKWLPAVGLGFCPLTHQQEGSGLGGVLDISLVLPSPDLP